MNSTANDSSLLQLGQLLQDLPLGDHVQGGGRLVHDHHGGLQGQRHGDHDPLPHPAGQLVRVAAQPVGVDPDHLQQLAGPLAALRPGPCRGMCACSTSVSWVPMVSTGLSACMALCITTAMRDQRSSRSWLSSAASRSRRCPAVAVPAAVQPDLAAGDHAGRAQQPGHGVGQRGLAAAALPGQAQHRAAVQGQVGVDDGVHHAGPGAVVHLQARAPRSAARRRSSGPRCRAWPRPARRSPGLPVAAGRPDDRRQAEHEPARRDRLAGPLARRRDSPAARSRGLMNSSMPKFSSASEVPSRATSRPAGTYHHQ